MKIFKIILIVVILGLIGFGIYFVFNPNMFYYQEVPIVTKQTIIKANGIKEDDINGEKVSFEREYYFVLNEENEVTACLVRDYNLTKEQLEFEYNRLNTTGFESFIKDLSKDNGILSYSSIMFLSTTYDELIKSLEEQNFTYEKL